MTTHNIEQISDTVRINYCPIDGGFAHDILVERLIDNQWQTYTSFNMMSDDYAITNAKRCAKKLAASLNGTSSLTA